MFDIPSKGTNITLSEVLEEHRDSITDIASEVRENPVWSPRHRAQLLSQAQHEWMAVQARPHGLQPGCKMPGQLVGPLLPWGTPTANWKPVCQPFLLPMCFPLGETQS